MRYISILFFVLIGLAWANSSLGQTVNFEEGFEDGDFTNNPTWNGDTGDFTVVQDSPNWLLRLNASTSPAYLSTPLSNTVGSWEFYIEFRGFEPSGSNQANIFLMSDIADLEGPVNGYAIQVGESGDDVFRLVRYDSGSEAATVLSDNTIVQSGGGYTVRVSRNNQGDWQLQVAEGYGGAFNPAVTGTDNTHTSASYFGPKIDFTSSRSDRFYMDFKIDLPPLQATDAKLAGSSAVDISFNRAIDQSSVQTSYFSIDHGLRSPSSVSFPASDTVRIAYEQPFPSNKYTVSVSGVTDQSGNAIQSGSEPHFIVFGTYASGDVKLNEFMYDPPSSQAEYVEILNTSNKYLDLSGWQIGDNLGTDNLGSDPVVLQPSRFLVISPDTTALFNTYGSRSYHQFSRLASLNNGGDAIRLITASGALADSLSYTSSWGGSNVSLERRSVSVPGTYQENWGDSPNPDGGTPGMANEIFQDNSPPELTDLNINSGQTLELFFDERLSSPAAADLSNYNITNTGISSNSQTGANSVELVLSSPLQNARDYTITVSGIEDIFGNAIPPTDTTFSYYQISFADSGDVFINEFSYNPVSGSTEYVEIYNPSTKSLDLQGWTLSDNRGNPTPITGKQFIVPPDSFAVITPDNTLALDYPDIALVAMAQFPALNNSGDDIVLRKADGTLMDSLQYTSKWGGNEVALERRTISASGINRENWGDAPNGFGTPGSANNIATDETPPIFKTLSAVDASTLHIVFSETITPASATNKQNYQITPSREVQLISAKNNSVTLFLDEEMTSGEAYTVTTSNISDLFGNVLPEASREVTFLRIEQAQPGDIVINEIMYNPGSEGMADFVELYNASGSNFDLSGWVVGDASRETTLPKNVQLRGGGYFVLTGSKVLAGSLENAVAVANFPALNNSTEDAVYLRTDNGVTIDSLRYSQSWGASFAGTSLERKDPRGASNDASNWQTSSAGNGSSAGIKNPSFKKDTSPPVVIFSKILPGGNIELRFNEFIRLTEEVKFLAGKQQLSVTSFDSTNANKIILSDPAKALTGAGATITVHNLSDVRGNIRSSSEVAVAQPLQPADLVINEIMFNPLNKTDDNRPDQSEYIELRNTRDYPISLEGLVLHDAPDEDGNLRELQPVESTAKWVPAQGEVLVYADQALSFGESKIANFFDLDTPDMRSVMRVDRSSLSLASSGDAIYIADSTGATIDSVFYDASWHNPNIIDASGISLERISPEGPSSDESNWGSSVHAKGGTPNSENSIYQENAQAPKNPGISFMPNPFSPDDDGHEDNLFINYRLDQQDYLIKVRIYDRYGRLVRKLADGKQAGFEGQLIWDGRKNNGGRNRIGIYIVVFEAYDSASGRNKAFKETVVLARKLN